MNILQTPTFIKLVKKLHSNQVYNLNNAIRKILSDPFIGERKKGDLNNVLVYKFKMVNQLTLLAYLLDFDAQQITLLAFGSHENFYRNLKN